MRKVVAYVIPAEGLHGERVRSQDAHLAHRSGSRLAVHLRGRSVCDQASWCGKLVGSYHATDEGPVLPGVGLVDQRYCRRSTATKDDGINRDSLRILPLGVDHRALRPSIRGCDHSGL